MINTIEKKVTLRVSKFELNTIFKHVQDYAEKHLNGFARGDMKTKTHEAYEDLLTYLQLKIDEQE